MYVVADIGGTKSRIAASADLCSFSTPTILPTAADYDLALEQIISVIEQSVGDTTLKGLCVGVPGLLSRDKRHLRSVPNLPAWNNRPFASDLEKRLDTSVLLENDADQVGLGEALYGAGKGASIVAYLTVSTGVGGTRIVEGKIDRSFDGYEPGGQYVSMHDPLLSLEDLISGKAIHKQSGIQPEHHGKTHSLWPQLARTLAFGVHNAILFWSPERVVIGGAVMSDTGIQIDLVRSEVARIMKKFPDVPEIVHSSLGDYGGLWGALACLQQTHAGSTISNSHPRPLSSTGPVV